MSRNGTNVVGGINDFGIDYSLAAPAAAGTAGTPATGYGYYVDVNSAGAFGTAGTSRGLIMPGDPATTGYGAILGENLFRSVALGMADYEPDYCYMIASPELMTQLRIANLVDQTKVTEGNLQFDTIFSGKFRLLMSRTNQGDFSGSDGVTNGSDKTTYLVKPGALEMAMLSIPMPVEMFRDANTYSGSGSTDIWYRWGYVVHLMGYDWAGSSTRFAINGTSSTGLADAGDDVTRDSTATINGVTYEASQTSGGGALNAGGSWTRKFDMLNLGILPIFHS